MLGGGANAALSTWGMLTGDGLMGFLRTNRLGHVGLVQAYLLIAVLGIALWIGSRQSDPRPWNRIGALAHLAILPAYALHWDFFPEVAREGASMRNAIFFHLTFLLVEGWAGLTPNERSKRAAGEGPGRPDSDRP
jgi:hypothetical protein